MTGCCGDRRRALTQAAQYVTVKYEGAGHIKVKGGMTGKDYCFDGWGSTQKVDKRDLSNVGRIPGMRIVE